MMSAWFLLQFHLLCHFAVLNGCVGQPKGSLDWSFLYLLTKNMFIFACDFLAMPIMCQVILAQVLSILPPS